MPRGVYLRKDAGVHPIKKIPANKTSTQVQTFEQIYKMLQERADVLQGEIDGLNVRLRELQTENAQVRNTLDAFAQSKREYGG